MGRRGWQNRQMHRCFDLSAVAYAPSDGRST
jgi:hypothetical protein